MVSDISMALGARFSDVMEVIYAFKSVGLVESSAPGWIITDAGKQLLKGMPKSKVSDEEQPEEDTEEKKEETGDEPDGSMKTKSPEEELESLVKVLRFIQSVQRRHSEGKLKVIIGIEKMQIAIEV